MWDVVVIGAGMAGLSTAIWARRLGLSALVLERNREPGGQLTAIHGRIIDYPGLDLPDGAALVNQLVRQAHEAGAEIRLDWPVLAVDAAARSCMTPQGVVSGGALVIATGLRARRLEVPGEESLHERQLVRRPSHDLAWFAGKRVAVIGGGDRAAENSLMLGQVADRVYLLHRGERLRARPEFTAQLAAHGRIEARLKARVTAFEVGEDDRVTIALEGAAPLVVDGVCVYIGNRPNSELVAGQVALDGDGYIITDRQGQTSQPGVFAVGDVCTPPAFQSLATAAGQAMAAAKQAALQRGS